MRAFMKKIVSALTVLACVGLSGCQYMTPTLRDTPLSGYFYSAVDWDGKVSNPGVMEEKTGIACADSYLGLVALGDASIAAAKQAGNISKVSSVDHTAKSYFVFYGQYCTVVRGE
jgi:TRL-like protein family